MAATKYTYSISNDFLNSIVESTALTSQIQLSSITRVLDYINTIGDDCDIWFLDTLTSGDVTTLSGVVAAHDGTALPSTAEQVELSEEYRDRSGKLRVQQTSRKLGMKTYFTGAGDDLTSVSDVGGGELLAIDHTISGSTTQSVTIDFNIVENETWVHEGYISWKNSHHDTVTFEMVASTVDYTASSGTYYNLYGGYLVIPAAGDGTIAITSDITTHSGGLVYMPLNDLGEAPTAYWNADWNSTTNQFENIAAAPAGNGQYNMFTVSVTLAKFANRLPLLKDGFMMLQTSDVEQLGQGMRFKLTGTTDTSHIGDHDWSLAGILTMFREKTV